MTQVFGASVDSLHKSFSSDISAMRPRRFFVAAFMLSSLLGLATPASADWSELLKDEDIVYYFDKDTVMPAHVSRYAWVLTDLSKNDKTPAGENYKSMMMRVRLFCKTDMVVRLSVSYFDKAMGKGKEVGSDDLQELRTREAPVRPNTYMAALKKEVCALNPKPAA